VCFQRRKAIVSGRKITLCLCDCVCVIFIVTEKLFYVMSYRSELSALVNLKSRANPGLLMLDSHSTCDPKPVTARYECVPPSRLLERDTIDG
jgi:hypothetical protein